MRVVSDTQQVSWCQSKLEGAAVQGSRMSSVQCVGKLHSALQKVNVQDHNGAQRRPDSEKIDFGGCGATATVSCKPSRSKKKGNPVLESGAPADLLEMGRFAGALDSKAGVHQQRRPLSSLYI